MRFAPAAAVGLGLFLALSASTTFAQEAAVPFDMSGERGPTADKKPDEGNSGTTTTTPTTTQVEQKPVVKPPARRYIVSAPSLMLEGEVASRSFPIYLTKDEAAGADALNLGYSNAVVVAPEASRLTVVVNDVPIGEMPVQSAEGTKDVQLKLPAGLLRPGVNRVTFNATHRHRTDCTIRSTYDLWTAIDPARTFLTLPDTPAGRLQTMDDIPAIGVGPTGQTKFILVLPEMGQPAATKALMRLSQGLAMMAKMPNQTFDVVNTMPATLGAGELAVVVGTAGDLTPILPRLPATAGSSAIATFVDAPAGDGKVLAVSGPDWPSIENAVEGIVSPIDRPLGILREALSVRQRNATEMPLVYGEATLTLAALGVRTGEFSGRRFRTGFDIGIPSDFYADAYGEATLLLDAAYAPDVLPGSHFDVYVNGNLASTVPFNSRNGGIFRHLPIRVTMRHLRPGPNRIDIEAILLTQADAVCAPGASALQEPRFALFDTSELRVPNFARIGQMPNLAALSGTAFPYNGQPEPAALYLDRLDSDTLSTGATFLGRLAVSGGRALQVRPESSALAIGDRNAILIGTLSQLPPLVLSQTHIAAESASTWGAPVTGDNQQAGTQEAIDQWQSRVRGGAWRSQVAAFQAWLQETFDISFSSLRLLPGEEQEVVPDDSAQFLIAQGDSPDHTATWTVLSAPTGASLKAGMAAMAQDARWQQLDGYASLDDKASDSLDTRPVSQTRFVPTQPWSFSNMRLIAANWLSSNILSYALAFCGLSLLLGMATWGLLRRFGRQL
ncbi:cellulose biosynthesis cyclic di-GMP-binding regulatory protein BcsB [Shinella sumterensis]|uniref:cellulose biosynthesis cyclic di-GMP-binding regulatory protein BcsB n=1 Tax=Shinella sumterensis TaxID=1967501 RepID=UPI003F849275